MNIESSQGTNCSAHEYSPGEQSPIKALVASTSGDWVSQCMLVMSKAKSTEYSIGQRNIKYDQQRRKELKKNLERFIEKQKEAENTSGVLGIVSKVVGGIIAAVGAVVSIYFPPAGLLISLGGIALAGGLDVAASHYDRFATDASIGQMRTNNQIDMATVDQSDTMSALKTLARSEKNMAQRLADFSDKQDRPAELALQGGRS